MLELVKNYGEEFKDITSLISYHENQFRINGESGRAKAAEKELDELFNKAIMHPRDAKKLAILLSKEDDLTEEELIEVADLKALEEKGRAKFCAKDIIQDIKAEIGIGNTLSVLKREKIRKNAAGNKVYTPMNYLPKALAFLDNPLKEDVPYPTSVYRVQVKKDIADLSGEKIIHIGFLSACYNNYDKIYEAHNWKVTFKVVKDKSNDEVMTNVPTDDDLM